MLYTVNHLQETNEDPFSRNKANIMFICFSESCLELSPPDVHHDTILGSHHCSNLFEDNMVWINFKPEPADIWDTYMSLVLRKPAFCICENKDADQLCGYCEADQRLCFRYIDSAIPLLSKSEISSLYPSSMAVQPGLCRTRSETQKTGFLRTRLISYMIKGYEDD